MSRNMGWTGNAGDGDYNNALNWDDFTDNLNPASSPPTGVDFVSFYGSTGAATVAFAGGSAETFNVSGSETWTYTGSLTLSGQPSPLNTPYAFNIGATVTFSDVTFAAAGYGGIGSPTAGQAFLTVQGGSTVTTQGDGIGSGTGQTGALVLTGTGTTWHVVSDPANDHPNSVTGYLSVGYGAATATEAAGAGDLTITAAAALTVDTGAAIAISAGSAGTAIVSDGGTWTVNGADGLTIGQSGTGSLTVEGTGSTVAVNGQIGVGQNAGGVGTLSIGAGGTFEETEASQSSLAMYIGNQGSGTVTVTGSGALLDLNDNPLSIGQGATGVGSLTVSAGGTVKVGTSNGTTGSSALYLGRSGTGALTINGTGSVLSAAGYVVDGRAGNGTILVENSGSLISTADPVGNAGLSIGDGNSTAPFGTGGSGSATVTTDGVLSSAANINVGGNDVNGALNVNNGGTVDVGTDLNVGIASLISGVTYSGDGYVAIGAGGTIQVTGAAQDAYFAVNIGTQSNSAAPLSATGELTVSGTGAYLNTNGSGISVGINGIGSLAISQGGSVVAGTPNSNVSSALRVGTLGIGSVSITGSGSSLTADGFVSIGRAGTGSLSVEDSATMTIALDPTGSGNLSIGGAGSNTSTTLYVGGTGAALVTTGGHVSGKADVIVGSNGVTGALTVNNGGTVEAAKAIDIGNSATIAIGGTIISQSGTTTLTAVTVFAGAGTVNIGAGGTLKTDGSLPNGSPGIVVGNGAGSSGTLNVSGAGALVNADGDRITIGGSGDGTMLVSQGGTAEAGASYSDTEAATNIGGNAGATGALTVTDTGSTYTATGAIVVGAAGTGSLLVENGGTVSATSLDAAENANAVGIITATGAGSAIDDTGDFTLGDAGSAELSVLNGATVTVGGNLNMGVSAGSTANIDLEGKNSLLHVEGDLNIAEAGSAVITIGAGTTLSIDGDSNPGALSRIVGLGGTVDPKHYNNPTTTTGPLIVGASIAIVNSGTFVAENGLLELNGPVTDTGVIQIDATGLLQLDQTVVGTQTVTFSGIGGVLDIKDPTGFAPTISGYAAGDTVQVHGISGQPAPSYSLADGDTTLTYDNGITLTFAGTFDDGSITVNADPTSPPPPPPCFLISTRIATEHGDIAVEDLRIGDRVLTAAGGSRPVRWIGTRRVDAARHPDPRLVWPVRVRADAIEPGRPRHDLWLSPDHAVFEGGLLIPIRLLMNGGSIAQVPIDAVTYFHVELDRHDILLAEGLPAESYLDTGNRNAFENGAAPMMLHADFAGADRNDRSCAPPAVAAALVAPIWQRLADRSPTIGQPAPHAGTVTADAQLRLIVSGRSLNAVAANDGSVRFELPPDIRAVRLASRANSPADIRPWLDDRRRLGVAISRITFHSARSRTEMSVDHPALSRGWHDPERDQDRLWRWTDGNAVVDVPTDTTMMEVHVFASHEYIMHAEGTARAA